MLWCREEVLPVDSNNVVVQGGGAAGGQGLQDLLPSHVLPIRHHILACLRGPDANEKVSKIKKNPFCI